MILTLTFPNLVFGTDLNCIVGGEECENKEESMHDECICNHDPLKVGMGIFTIITLPFTIMSGRAPTALDAHIIQDMLNSCYCPKRQKPEPNEQLSEFNANEEAKKDDTQKEEKIEQN